MGSIRSDLTSLVLYLICDPIHYISNEGQYDEAWYISSNSYSQQPQSSWPLFTGMLSNDCMCFTDDGAFKC